MAWELVDIPNPQSNNRLIPESNKMKLFVAITDSDWFDYLADLRPDEANFWRPSGAESFRSLSPGEPLLFKLHSPNNFIVGGGFFSHYTVLPASFAWGAFGEKNGAKTETEMRRRIEKYRRVEPGSASDYNIGCILLQSPFFFPPEEWIVVSDWPRQTVQGKGYSTDEEAGRRIWAEVSFRLQARAALPVFEPELVPNTPRFGQPQMVMPRLGQGAFRVIVTDVYNRQCALTNSHVLHVLDAAHIRPYAEGGSHSPSNGLLLRQDLHTLFDRGYLTVSPDYHVEVSRRLKDEFDNGKEYYALQGKTILLPDNPAFRPSTEQLGWHNESKYRP
jgi:putative restriction endonuclease